LHRCFEVAGKTVSRDAWEKEAEDTNILPLSFTCHYLSAFDHAIDICSNTLAESSIANHPRASLHRHPRYHFVPSKQA
jgi:hypothetical protein